MNSPIHSRSRVAIAAGVVLLIGGGLALGSRADAGSSTSPMWTEEPTTTTTVPPVLEAATTIPPTTAAAVADPSLFVKNVNAFYGKYSKLDSNIGTRELINKYVADPYGKTLNWPLVDYDQVLCAQNFPRSVNVGAPRVNGNAVTVVVTEQFGSGLSTVSVTGDATSGLITNISCPGL